MIQGMTVEERAQKLLDDHTGQDWPDHLLVIRELLELIWELQESGKCAEE